MKNHFFKKLLNLVIVLSIILVGLQANADFEQKSGLSLTAKDAGYEEAGLIDRSIPQIVGEVIKLILTFLGVFFLILTIYAGFIWMFSRGNSEQVEKAKKILQNAIIGLIIIVLSYAITYFVGYTITSIEAPEAVPVI